MPQAAALWGRIVEADHFQWLLGTTARVRSKHFALHHAVAPPRGNDVRGPVDNKLSTGGRHQASGLVDDLARSMPRLGMVVPKRHARRAVTRTLIKREMRAAVRLLPVTASGWWVLRLHSSFSIEAFPSAASRPLAGAIRTELDDVLRRGWRLLGVPETLAPSATTA